MLRLYSHPLSTVVRPNHRNRAAVLPAAAALRNTCRDFWGFSKGNDDREHSKTEKQSSSPKEKGGLVSASGDNSPTLSPIIILPSSRRPVFPGYLSAITIRDTATIDAITNNTSSTSGYVGLFLRRLDTSGNDTIPGFSDGNHAAGADVITQASDIFSVGTFSQVQSIIPTEFGTQLLLLGHRRITLGEVSSFGPPTIAGVSHWKRPMLSPQQQQSPHMKALLNEVLSTARELIKHNPLLQEQLNHWVSRVDFNDPLRLADFATALTTAEGVELQRVLEAKDPEERLSITLELLAQEKELAKLQREISKQVEEKVSKQQREYFLREQLKNIKKELGMERDDKEDMLQKYREKLVTLEGLLQPASSTAVSSTAAATSKPAASKAASATSADSAASLDDDAKATSSSQSSPQPSPPLPTKQNRNNPPGITKETVSLIRDEIKKLEGLEKNSPEFNVTRSYLDWLVALPWGKFSQDRLELQTARGILDEDHYGLQEIKERILEFIAVGKLKGTVAGKILCFIGPPGVGKTSIAKSIARALDKQFYRFSVGGLTDTAEIKGHRRTYIGAMPGKPVLCLKSTATLNPLILIDEIDKLGRSHNGDPASALLELLDPNQNSSFVDHYLDTPVDFSNVLFVCTANDESTIPGPLRDRMEIVRLSGYDIPEKVAIASRYLVPKALHDAGLLDTIPPHAATVHSHAEAQDHNHDQDQNKGRNTLSVADQQLPYQITEGALKQLVKNYCRESGVRSLEKAIERIARKIAFRRVGEDERHTESSNNGDIGDKEERATFPDSTISSAKPQHSMVVTEENLEEFAGKPVYIQDTIYDNSDGNSPLPPGVVMGLAWNPLGGSPIFIETAAIPVAYSDRGGGGGGGGVRIITGQLGDVMKESVNIAYTFARQFVSNNIRCSSNRSNSSRSNNIHGGGHGGAKNASEEWHEPNTFFNSHQLHLHVPEGAVSKDGPSAGVAMATSLISIATNLPLQPRVAMTGELSLTGKVLPVGGIKEKVLAARRAGADTVILPAANKRDYDQLPDYVKESVTVHFASEYHQVFDIVFPPTA